MSRRFTRQVGAGRRSWEVALEGAEVHYTTGVVGGRQRTRVEAHGSIEEAAQVLNEAVAAMVASGWTEVRGSVDVSDEPVDPEDVGQMLVLADALTEAGDPRGELIVLQASGASGEGLVDLHRAAWLGPLHGEVQVTWRRGFVDRVVLPRTVDASAEMAALLATGSLRFVRSIAVDAEVLDGVCEQLAGRAWPWLTELRLAGDGPIHRPLADLLSRMPAVREVVLQGTSVDWTAVDSPSVTALQLTVEELDAEVLAGAVLPGLETVSVGVVRAWGADRAALQRFTSRPVRCLTLGGHAVVEWLQGVSSEVKVGRLVLEGAPTPGEVSFWLEERQAMLGGMPIEVRGFELTDQEVARLGALRLDLPLPDVAVRRGLDARSPLQDRVRRFEKVAKSGARFWSVVREGLEVVVRHGRVGSEGREQRSAYRTEHLAAGEYRRRVRRKVAGGWGEV